MQLRLPGFDLPQLATLGQLDPRPVRRGLGAPQPTGSRDLVDDAYIADLADAVTGALGGQVGVAPRVFLRKLVADVLDRVDQFADFDPRRHYALTLSASELTETERNAAALPPPRTRRRHGPRPADRRVAGGGRAARPAAPDRWRTTSSTRSAGPSLRPLQREAARAGAATATTRCCSRRPRAARPRRPSFPLLTRMAAEGWTGLSVIYLCPLKALLNNLLPRLEVYGAWLGRRVALWHGDTPASARASRSSPTRPTCC